MSQLFSYLGSERFINAVEDRIFAAGYERVENVASANIVITFCLFPGEQEEIFFGDSGLVHVLKPGSLLVDLSPSTPTFIREISAVATISDLTMVEAPFVVQDMAAEHAFEKENLVCFAASENDGVEQARDLLDALFCEVHELSVVGAGQLARASYTIQTAAQVVAVMESRALYRESSKSVIGVSFGEPEFSLAITDAARSMLQAIEQERFDGDFTVEMLMAEMLTALMAADDAELILPQAEAAVHLLELLAVIGGSDKAPAALSLTYGDDKECAKHGLDWDRAEKIFGNNADEDAFENFIDMQNFGYSGGNPADSDEDYDDYDDYDEDPDDDYDDFDDPYANLGFSIN